MRLLLMLLTAFLPVTLTAQISNIEKIIGGINLDSIINASKTKEVALNPVIEAIKPELCMIRQQYRLEQNGKYYGKNSLVYYGETYSLGVKIGGGLLFLRDVVKPWQDDPDYKRVNSDNRYNTEIYYTYQRFLNDTTYNAVELELGSETTTPQNTDSTLWLHPDRDTGLDLDLSSKFKVGYLIWVNAVNGKRDSAMKIRFVQTDFSVDTTSVSFINLKPNTPENVLGGLFVTPKYGKGGRVQFLLAGIAVHQKGNNWALQLFAQSAQQEIQGQDTITPTVISSSTPTPSEVDKPSSSKKIKRTKKKTNKK